MARWQGKAMALPESRPVPEREQRSPGASAVEIVRVRTKADLDRFIRVPWRIYRDDPHWVPPLVFERRQHLDRTANPFFDHAEVQLWLALRGGEAVGRISAQVDQAALSQHQDAAGHFGFLEAEDDGGTFAALLQTAEAWLRDRGLRTVRGPFSLSINDESGLLIEGYERPPALMMGHAPPYYGRRLEDLGYAKVRDLIAYDFDVVTAKSVPPEVRRLVDSLAKRPNVTVRRLRKSQLARDLKAVLKVFNDAWSNNWGFIPFSEVEIAKIAKDMRPLIREDFVCIVEIDGDPAAFALALPDLNEAMADLNGALLPFGHQGAHAAHGGAQEIPGGREGRGARLHGHREGPRERPAGRFRGRRAVLGARGQPAGPKGHRGGRRRAVQDLQDLREGPHLSGETQAGAHNGDDRRFTALILAASRGAADPVAKSEGTSHKCLVDVVGVPMLTRVVDTLSASPSIARIAISIETPEVLEALPAIAEAVAAGRITVLPSGPTTSASVLRAAEALASPYPLLIVTADNPLLTPEMVEHFCAEALVCSADLAVGLASETVVRKAFPAAQRTFLRFRDDRYSGCNLYALAREAGLAAVRFWAAAERHRKRPWRLVATFGLVSLVLFLFGWLTLDDAFARASRVMKVRAKALKLPFPTAPIDVDKPTDLALVRRILVSGSS
jgi:GTP:adenosylcobinamide-phosphate guanylyltransferase